MKKLSICLSLMIMLLAAFALSAAAISPEEITMEMLAEVNSTEKLLETHSSYYYSSEYEGEFIGGTYADSELFYSYTPGAAGVYANGKECEFVDDVFAVRLYAGREPDIEWTKGLILYDPDEEIIEVAQEDEKFIVKTRSSLLAYGEEIEGGYCEFVYELDAQHLYNIGGSYTSYTSDGTPYINILWKVEYDVERPAEAQELLERMNPQEDYRTVTIVLDPGTENETVCSATARIGDLVNLYLGSEYTNLYSDAECTQPYVSGGEPVNDITLYTAKTA